MSNKGLGSPVGVLAFSKSLYDNTDKFASGKYRATLLLEKGVAANEEFVADLNAKHAGANGDEKEQPAKDGDALGTKGQPRAPGHYLVSFKTAKMFTIKDATNKPLKAGQKADSGDLIQIGYKENLILPGGTIPWNGLSLQLLSVRLLEKRAADFDFGDEWEGEGRFVAADYASPAEAAGGASPGGDARDF